MGKISPGSPGPAGHLGYPENGKGMARKYHTSIQEIRTINALKENQEPSPGTPLLVVKKVEGQIK